MEMIQVARMGKKWKEITTKEEIWNIILSQNESHAQKSMLFSRISPIHCDSESYKQARRLGVLSIVVDFRTAWKRKLQYAAERGNFAGQYSTKKSPDTSCPKNLTAKKVTNFSLLCTMGNQHI